MKNLLTYLIILIAAVGCGDSNYDIVYKQIPHHDWKYSRGYYMGDYLSSGIIEASNDTIFKSDSAIALIQSLELRKFDMVMNITSLNTKEKGRYVSK